MDRIEAIGLIIIGLIVIIGLLTLAVIRDNRTIEQSEKICLKAYKSDLKNDDEIKELCKGVKVKLFKE